MHMDKRLSLAFFVFQFFHFCGPGTREKLVKIAKNTPKVAPFFIVKDFDQINVTFLFYISNRTFKQKSGDGPFFFYLDP